MKILKKTLKWILLSIPVLVIAFFLYIVSLFTIPSIENDIVLNNFSQQLYQIKLPSTKVIETYSTCGNLSGTGNGMDFLASVLIETDLTYKELKVECEKKKIKQAKPGAAMQYGGYRDESYPVSIDIVNVEDENQSIDDDGHIKFKSLENLDDYSRYYALVICDGGYYAGGDLRGH